MSQGGSKRGRFRVVFKMLFRDDQGLILAEMTNC
jgi:hypothetical protein